MGGTAVRPYHRAHVGRPPIAGKQEMKRWLCHSLSNPSAVNTSAYAVYMFAYTFVCMLMKGRPYEFDLKIFHSHEAHLFLEYIKMQFAYTVT